MKNSWVIVLLILFFAFFVRIIVAQYYLSPNSIKKDSINRDLIRYKNWAISTNRYGISKIYIPNNKILGTDKVNQPFGIVYLHTGAYIFYSETIKQYHIITKNILSETDFDRYFLLTIKLVSILADMLIGLMIYKIIKEKTSIKWAIICMSLFLFNPATIYSSSAWGQTDSINNLLFFIAIYLLSKQQLINSTLLYVGSLLIKISLLPVLPLYFAIQNIIFKKIALKKITVSIFVFALSILVLTCTVSNNPFQWLVDFMIKNSAGELSYITVYTFNFWWLLLRPKFLLDVPSSYTLFLGITLSIWGYILFIIVFIPILIKVLKGNINNEKSKFEFIILSVFVVEFLSFLFLPRMHERYLYPVLPFFITYIGVSKRRKLNILFFFILTSILFINMYVVWHPIFIFPVLFEGLIAHWKMRWLMSLVLVLICLYYYWVHIIYKKKTKNLPSKITDIR